MRQKSFWEIAVAAALCASLANAAKGDGVVNEGAKTWRVAFQKDQHHPKTNDIALRLRVTATGDTLSATLTRYDRTEGTGTSEKYKRRAGPAGKVSLTGAVLSTGGGTTQRKPETFILTGYFVDSMGAHQVTIRGIHSQAKNLGSHADDHVCLRFHMKDFNALAAPAGGYGDPCDEQPPDEDVLTEDDPPTGMNDDDPYDGG